MQSKIEHWIDAPHDSTLETPSSKKFSLIPCPGCSRGSLGKNRKGASTSASIRCMTNIPLLTSIRLTTTRSRISKKNEIVKFRDIKSNIIHRVNTFSDRLSLTPNFEQCIFPPITPSMNPDTINMLKNFLNEDLLSKLVDIADSLTTHHTLNFYSDGSLSYPTFGNLKMGFGWNCYDTDFNLLNSFNASTQYWPSSTRAELSALLSIFMVAPINSQLHIYTDSQTLIQGFNALISPTSKQHRAYLQKQNYIMWSCVEIIYKSHNLSVTLHKVRAHTDDIYNNMADELAKKGANSDIKGCPDLINLSPIKFIPKFYSLPIETNIKHFINNIYQAKQFQNLLSLQRFKLLNRLNVDRAISWDATWYTFSLSLHGTSFVSSYRKSIKTKLFYDELPTLESLKHRRPDLYLATILCFCCNLDTETLDHLWTCSSRTSVTEHIIAKVQNSLFTKLKKINDTINLSTLKANPIWTWQYSNSFVGGLLFTRGIIPTSLVEQISAFTSNQKLTFDLIRQTHEHIIDL